MSAMIRLATFVTIAGVGLSVAKIGSIDLLDVQEPYFLGATALLAIGLYGSTREISTRAARTDIRTAVLAITVGVVTKAAVIAGVLILVFRQPEYLILGIAVAQIDPLSVAALSAGSRMSARAKSLLRVWASFDDPITMILTIYLTAVTLQLAGRYPETVDVVGDGQLTIATSLLANLVFVAFAYVVWRVFGRWNRRHVDAAGRSRSIIFIGVAAVVVIAFAVVAVVGFLMLAVALVGLFFRPDLGLPGRYLTGAASYVATLTLGMLLASGIDVVVGLVLGVAAFVSQVVVGSMLTWRMRREDRIYLALGQQNGITAVILALLLEPTFPGTVGIVAPAIVVVGMLHASSNALADRSLHRPPPVRGGDVELDPKPKDEMPVTAINFGPQSVSALAGRPDRSNRH